MAQFDWQTYQVVRDQFQRAAQEMAGSIVGHKDAMLEHALSNRRFESPMEAVFAIWWTFSTGLVFREPKYALRAIEQREVTAGKELFRVDFQVVPRDPLMLVAGIRLGCPMKIAVELDGHDFHERTKEQVMHRNHRDRRLQADGWVVMHMSGSELLKRPIPCVLEVIQVAAGALTRIREAVGREWSASLTYEAMNAS